MAGKIKGITIEIGGNTQPLNKSLEGVNKKTKSLQSELKQVERLLKLDPKNTELLAQKQKLLAEAVSTSKEKLDILKEAERQAQEQFKQGKIGEEQYRALQREVIKTEQDLQKFEKQLAEVTKTTKTWKEQLDKASAGLKNAGAKMTDIGKNLSTKVTAPIVAAGGAILALGVKAGQTADRLLDLRDITGLSTDSIQEWQYVANQAGVESEVMTNAVEGLVRKIPQLEQESKLVTEQLNKLGISFGDLKTMSPDEQIDTLMNLLADMEDPLDRNAVGAQLFGGAWKDLAPILGMGADGIAAVRQEARDLGIILDEDSIEKANEFRQQLDKLKASVSAIAFSIGADLGPILKNELGPIINDVIIPAFKSMAEKIGLLVKWFANLSPGMQKVILAVTGLAAAIGPLLVVIGAIASGISAVIGVAGTLAGALPALGTVFAALTGPIGIVVAAIAGLIAIGVAVHRNWDEIKAKAIEIWNKIKDSFTDTLNKIQQTFTNVWDGIKGFFKKWGAELILIAVGPAGWAVLLGRKLAENWDKIKAKALEIWNNLKTNLSKTWDSLLYSARNVWNNVKNAIVNPIETAKQKLMGIIRTIKNAFSNMKISIPKPKLPHVSVATRYKSLGGIRIPYPDFDLNWYKAGGIFRSPSVIGVGEAGDEVVIPLDKLPKLISLALKNALRDDQAAPTDAVVNLTFTGPINVRNDNDIRQFSRELLSLVQNAQRSAGRR